MPRLHESVSENLASDAYSIKIVTALAELLDETPLERITVNDVCERACVSRQTFYRHFGSKYEVVQWYWDRCARQFLFRVGVDLTWYESIRGNFELVRDNMPFFSIVSRESGYESCVEYGCRRRIETLERVVTEEVGVLLTDDLAFQIRFFADAESHALGRLSLGDVARKPEVMARMLEKCVPAELHELLDARVLAGRVDAEGGDAGRATCEAACADRPRLRAL